MSYKHEDKKIGDLIRSADWNTLSAAVAGASGLTLASDANDKVGIGTNDPSEKLEVNGTTRTRGLSFDQEVSDHINTDGALYRHAGQAYLNVDDNFYIRNSGTGGREKFHFDVSNTRLGIGKTSPTESLEVAGNVKATKFYDQAGEVMPTGAIIMWSGTTIPKGWAECNGANGTPDLRSRFIVGSGQGSGLSNYPLHHRGGEEKHTLNINEMPSHNHSSMIGKANDLNWSTRFGGPFPVGTDDVFERTNYPSNSQGGGKPHENRPPYYALMFIMKL